MAWDSGPSRVIGPDAGHSIWQPTPERGFVTVKVAPPEFASNLYAVLTYTVPRLPAHGHPSNEELKLVTTGTGVATVRGVEHRIEPGSLCVTGRWVEHWFLNTGDENITILAVFMPPALEGLIKELGRPRLVGQPAPEPFDAPADVLGIIERNSLVLPGPMQPMLNWIEK